MRSPHGAFGSDGDAPDVTDAVMRRLGYERVTKKEGRKRRLRRRVVRVSGLGLLLSVMVLGGLSERASRAENTVESLPAAFERSVETRAQLFHGLRAPLERLEQVLDRAISSGDMAGLGASELEVGSEIDVEETPSSSFLEESAAAPFSTS